MCGIYCSISRCTKCVLLSVSELEWLNRRGPDSASSMNFEWNGWVVDLCSCVMHMRGQDTKQPLVSQSNALCYAGNIWGGGLSVPEGENDTRVLLEALEKSETDEEAAQMLAEIEGPFAFIYYREKEGEVWFGRDRLGRRSLLWAADDDGALVLSSIHLQDSLTWAELPSGVLFSLKLHSDSYQMRYFPMREVELDKLNQLLQRIPASCAGNVSKLDFLFTMNKTLPSDNETATIFKDGFHPENFGKITFESEVDGFVQVLSSAVRKRTSFAPSCQDCERDCAGHSKLGILFSGGVDSLLLAALTHRVLEADSIFYSLDLLNVAFEQRSGAFDVPDRQTGLAAWHKLEELFPERKWNFVSINISKQELVTVRAEHIARLISPCRTVLDDSIGCALWFAARGRGVLERSGEYYRSPAKVILVGTGADELLGGYSRHRMRFERDGWTGLIQELEMELGRISSRNLGRDDRIISDHGRESRLPFLDEELIRYLNSVEIWRKVNLTLPRGQGDKLLLRMALWGLGFQQLAFTPKRAMQFGSRIAKLEDSRERADQVSSRLSLVNKFHFERK